MQQWYVNRGVGTYKNASTSQKNKDLNNRDGRDGLSGYQRCVDLYRYLVKLIGKYMYCFRVQSFML